MIFAIDFPLIFPYSALCQDTIRVACRAKSVKRSVRRFIRYVLKHCKNETDVNRAIAGFIDHLYEIHGGCVNYYNETEPPPCLENGSSLHLNEAQIETIAVFFIEIRDRLVANLGGSNTGTMSSALIFLFDIIILFF